MELHLNLYVVALLFVNLQTFCEATILGGLGIAGAGMAIGAALHWGNCRFKECCTDRWTRPDDKKVDRIFKIFKTNLFGQHIVMNTVPHAIHNHLNDKNPQKALVMSFHGCRGCGKSFVSRLIANYIFKEGENSLYVHTMISSEHFPDAGKIEKYKLALRKFVREKTLLCGRSLFIFDEVDKMPHGLANLIKDYIDYQKVGDVDYRKNIFIFLNNIGGEEISDVALRNFREGKTREDIKSSTLKDILSRTLKLSFQSSELLHSGLVDIFIPFLPLERHHVKQCASVDIIRRLNDTERKIHMSRNKQNEIVEKTVEEIQFYPEGEGIFATTGCKHVTKKVDMFF